MSYIIHDTRINEIAQYAVDQHVEVIVEFKYNGTPVDVENPEFTVTKNGNPVTLYVLKPLQKTDPPEPGKYHTTFLTTGLQAGSYVFEAKGTYQGQDITVNGRFELREVPRVQWFIDTLRTYLSDRANIEVPWEFITRDPTKTEWRDGQLYDYLQMAVSEINAMPPATTHFTLENIPASAVVLKGAMLYALFGKDVMEVHNYFDYSTPVRVSLYRGREYARLWQYMDKAFYQPAMQFKKSWVLNSTAPHGIVWPRIAFRVMRPLSMVLHFTTYGIG